MPRLFRTSNLALNAKTFEDHQAIGADAKMAIGDFFRRPDRVDDLLVEAVNVHVIVADAVHLGESHRQRFYGFFRRRATRAGFARVTPAEECSGIR